MTNKKKKIVIIIPFVLIVVILSAVILWFYTESKPLNSSDIESQRIEILNGMTSRSTAEVLEQHNLIRNSKVFYLCARYPFIRKVLFGNESTQGLKLKSGIYYLNSSMTIPELFSQLSSGRQEYISVSIPEGYTISKIGTILEEKGICSKTEFISACHNSSLLAEYKILSDTAEGFLFPDTYFLIPNSNAIDVAHIFADTFFEKASSIKGFTELSDYEMNQAVRLASIIEREYKVPDEAPLIASVFKNRLRRGIGLYSCATVEYIITEIQGRPHPKKITYDDLAIDSPYNTYKWAGLPPSPISNPGLTALNAAVNTPKTSYYYFQVNDPKKGTHVFTSTFEEHIGNHNLVTIEK